MPNYSLIVNSEYQPLSYLELLLPALMLTQALAEVEGLYTELNNKAVKLRLLANSSVDKDSYEKYMAWANLLEAKAELLSKYGLQGRDKSTFMSMYRLFGSDIYPLLEALAKREQLIDWQRKSVGLNHTMLFDRSAGDISLQEIMSNPAAAPKSVNGAILMQQAAAMYKALLNELRESTVKNAGHGYLEFAKKYGVSAKTALAFMENPDSPEANPLLKKIFDNVLKGSGIDESWGADYNRAKAYIASTVTESIGKEVAQEQQDWIKHLQMLQAFQASENAKNRAFLAALADKEFQRKLLLAGLKNALNGNNFLPSSTNGLSDVNGKPGEYKRTVDKILTKDGKASSAYFGTPTKDNKTRNPLKIYEDYMKYAMEHKRTMMSPYPGVRVSAPDMDAALAYVKKKYGVTAVLTQKDYDNLKELGYNSSVDFDSRGRKYSKTYGYSSYMGKMFRDSVNRTAETMSSWSINANPKYIEQKLMSHVDSNTKFTTLNRNNKATGDDFSFEYDSNGKPKSKVINTEWSATHPGHVIVTVSTKNGAKRLLIPAGYIDELLNTVLHDVELKLPQYKANAAKDGEALGLLVSRELYSGWASSINQIQGETSSHAGEGVNYFNEDLF